MAAIAAIHFETETTGMVRVVKTEGGWEISQRALTMVLGTVSLITLIINLTAAWTLVEFKLAQKPDREEVRIARDSLAVRLGRLEDAFLRQNSAQERLLTDVHAIKCAVARSRDPLLCPGRRE